MTRYFAHISAAGPVRYGRIPGSIGVLEARNQPMPIRMESEAGEDFDGLVVWRLRIKGLEVPGRWVIIDRRFVAVENASAGSRSD